MALAFGSVALAAGAADPVARVIAAVGPERLGAFGLSAEALRRDCPRDALCAARSIVAGDTRARLARVAPPDTDRIRWVRNLPSVAEARLLADGRALVSLVRFGRKAGRELAAALETFRDPDSGGRWDGRLLLDLRGHRGGDLGRMLRFAGVFTGAVPAALRLEGEGGRSLDIPAPAHRPEALRELAGLDLLVGPETASSAEILAALLRRHAGARVLGRRTAGKDYLHRIVPIEQGWSLFLPAETVAVPGETLAGGLMPDGPLPPGLPKWGLPE